MDSNAGISSRRVVGMGSLWMVCCFHLVTSLEGKNKFCVMQQLNSVFSRDESVLANVFILFQMNIGHMISCLMVDDCLMRCKKILVLFLMGQANCLMKDH